MILHQPTHGAQTLSSRRKRQTSVAHPGGAGHGGSKPESASPSVLTASRRCRRAWKDVLGLDNRYNRVTLRKRAGQHRPPAEATETAVRMVISACSAELRAKLQPYVAV